MSERPDPRDGAAPVPPGGRVGILGAGQLGRMLAMAGARMGLRVRLFDPSFDPPGGHVGSTMQAEWDDEQALRGFARTVDVVTLEFENVPQAAMKTLEPLVPVYPSARVLKMAQDRYEEKTFLNAIGIETAAFAPISTIDHLADSLAFFDGPAILKTRRMGYDGKGQVRVNGLEEAGEALATFRGRALIVEKVVPFETELSVIIARGRGGEIRAYDPVENTHEEGILRRSMVPATVSAEVAARAIEIATTIVERSGHVGVMGVEFFVTADDRLLVNEVAPRVHNSGHWTIEACMVDQFEQHLRAVCGWPLGDTTRFCNAVMDNLIGSEVDEWQRWAGQSKTALHIYGKREALPGRKMGHVTRVSSHDST
jgi:5-(carboxyamino)imidazole ribonucleotide synthase